MAVLGGYMVLVDAYMAVLGGKSPTPLLMRVNALFCFFRQLT